MNPHDRNRPIFLRSYPNITDSSVSVIRQMVTAALAIFCFIGGYMMGESRGFKEGQAIEKPCQKPVAFRDMTPKQQVKLVKFSSRDSGVIK